MTSKVIRPINEVKKIQLNFAVTVLALTLSYPIVVMLCRNSGLNFAEALAHYMTEKTAYVHEIQLKVIDYLCKTGLSYRD